MSISFPQLLIGVGVAGVVALLSWRLRLLKPSGASAAFLLGSVVFGLGGIPWSIPLITFFITGSLLSRFGPKRKSGLEEVFEKGATRDAGQVWANGGIAGLLVIIHAVAPAPHLFIAYLGALAAAAADTWGTEIGVLGGGRTISLLSFRPVERGTSGGVSLLGTAGATAGALAIALSGCFWEGVPSLALPVVLVAGLAGMFADSLAGSAIQARYRCSRCGTITEQRSHCNIPADLIAGRRIITNDAVNTICTFAGALAAWLLAFLLVR